MQNNLKENKIMHIQSASPSLTLFFSSLPPSFFLLAAFHTSGAERRITTLQQLIEIPNTQNHEKLVFKSTSKL